MARVYDYVLAVWLRLEMPDDAPELLMELREYIEAEYQITKLEVVEEPESDMEGDHTFALQLQLTFDESQMDGDDPAEEAIDELDGELRAFLEAKYQVNHLEILDDALTSYLLAEREEPEERKYAEPKQRDLSDAEMSQLLARIERGDVNIYELATEFGCSASQVAGIKAAMHR